MIEQFRELAATFKQLDPGAACWQFIQQHRPELWRDHMRAISESNLAEMAGTFKEMLTVWGALP